MIFQSCLVCMHINFNFSLLAFIVVCDVQKHWNTICLNTYQVNATNSIFQQIANILIEIGIIHLNTYRKCLFHSFSIGYIRIRIAFGWKDSIHVIQQIAQSFLVLIIRQAVRENLTMNNRMKTEIIEILHGIFIFNQSGSLGTVSKTMLNHIWSAKLTCMSNNFIGIKKILLWLDSNIQNEIPVYTKSKMMTILWPLQLFSIV